MGKILVIGSSNTDMIARVKQFPSPGETITGLNFLQTMGGKGANQALAAHRLGGNVSFITCLGRDANGDNSISYYKKEGLDISASLIVDHVSSGTAMIWVDDNGENCIVITPGANHELTSDYIVKIENEILHAEMVVLQMEIPYSTVKTVCELATKHHKKVMLNVAPAHRLGPDILNQIEILIVNETEAETITGEKIEDIGEEAMVDKLIGLGAKTVVLTLGKKGCFLKNKKERLVSAAFSVIAVDSTAAGDTFCGALAAELSRGHGWKEALKFATAASAICVTRLGAQTSIPTEKDVFEFLTKNILLLEN